MSFAAHNAVVVFVAVLMSSKSVPLVVLQPNPISVVSGSVKSVSVENDAEGRHNETPMQRRMAKIGRVRIFATERTARR